MTDDMTEEVQVPEGEAQATPKEPIVRELIPEARSDVPAWAKVPSNLTLPKGRQVLFVRFRGEWTYTPHKGERQAICWPLSVGDKRLALSRSMSDSQRAMDEQTKQMIRAVDGHTVSWEGPGVSIASVDDWWEEIGESCRALLNRMYVQLHFLKDKQYVDFLDNCVQVRGVV